MSSTEAEAVTRSIRRHLAIGMAVGLALIGAAGAWATTTQLAGAVVASGNFVVDSHVKKVQHPTGGVIGEILVEEGDWVKAGQVLMRLDPTQTKANLRIVTKRLDELMARLARLEAERDDRGELEFPTELKVRAKERAVASAINVRASSSNTADGRGRGADRSCSNVSSSSSMKSPASMPSSRLTTGAFRYSMPKSRLFGACMREVSCRCSD